MANPMCREWSERHRYLRGKSRAELVCTVLLSIHSDAGPCTKAKSATHISWSGLLAQGEEKGNDIYFAFVSKGREWRR